jgi:poly(hydroxyalkanoate) depolymerase family esterase
VKERALSSIFRLEGETMLLTSLFVRSHFSKVGYGFLRYMYRLRRLLVASVALFALLLSGPASQFVHARGGTWQAFVYDGPAGSRPYFVYTPDNYHPGTPVPLFVMLHGCTQTAADLAVGTQMDELADAHQFIVLYPQQTTLANPAACWNWSLPANQARGQGEPAILAGIVQEVEANTSQWTVDKSRVFVAGVSAGAVMSVILGATYPDIFAAIGVVAGVEYPGGANNTADLDPLKAGAMAYAAMGSYARIVPTLVFQGSADPVVAPTNGDLVVQQWMQTDHLASHGHYDADFANPSQSITASPPASHPYIERCWNDATGQEIQEYWVAIGAGHAWTGGNPAGTFTDPLGPNLSQIAYSFFLNHPMGTTPEGPGYEA